MVDPVTATTSAGASAPSPGGATGRTLRVFHLLPGPADSSNMVFAKNLIATLGEAGVACQAMFLRSRTSPLILMREAGRLQKELAQFCPDLIHAHYGTMTAAVGALVSRVPLVITFRGSDLNPCDSVSPLRSAGGKFLSQLAALRARRIICVSEQLKGRLWWNKRVSVVLPGGVDVKRFRPMPRDDVRSLLGWGAEEYVVIFNAGFDAQRKRADLAATAVALARKRCGAIRFEILDGRKEQGHIPFYLNAADCLLMTSDWEGSPNIVKEAMACSLPVVSVDAGDVRQRLMDVRPSRIVRRDPAEIAEALAEVLERRERSNGHTVIQDLSSEKMAVRVMAVYRDALSKSRRNPPV
ncbi:MAG: glycosyltransferase [Nitrospira sp.]